MTYIIHVLGGTYCIRIFSAYTLLFIMYRSNVFLNFTPAHRALGPRPNGRGGSYIVRGQLGDVENTSNIIFEQRRIVTRFYSGEYAIQRAAPAAVISRISII